MMRKTMRRSGVFAAAILLAQTAGAASTWVELFSDGGGIGGITDTGLAGHSAVYDPASNTMIAFGGSDAALNFATANAVLLFSPANGLGGTTAFTTLLANGTPGAPPSRAYHSAAYDSANNRMIVFGGATYADGHSDPSAYLNDVWVLTNANGQGGPPAWIQLRPAGTPPSPRYGQTAVYDAAGNRLIVFGGSAAATIFTDVWVLSNANGLGGTPAWTQLTPSGVAPPGGYGASAVYDAANNVVILFGGYNLSAKSPFGFVLFNGVWTLAHANGSGGTPHWTNIVANGASGAPGKRDVQTAVYDSANNRLIVFGGGSFSAEEAPSYNDVRVLAGANGLAGTPQWIPLQPAGAAPGRRGGHTAVYDAANNRMIMFAGASDDAQYYSVWILTGANGL